MSAPQRSVTSVMLIGTVTLEPFNTLALSIATVVTEPTLRLTGTVTGFSSGSLLDIMISALYSPGARPVASIVTVISLHSPSGATVPDVLFTDSHPPVLSSASPSSYPISTPSETAVPRMSETPVIAPTNSSVALPFVSYEIDMVYFRSESPSLQIVSGTSTLSSGCNSTSIISGVTLISGTTLEHTTALIM